MLCSALANLCNSIVVSVSVFWVFVYYVRYNKNSRAAKLGFQTKETCKTGWCLPIKKT